MREKISFLILLIIIFLPLTLRAEEGNSFAFLEEALNDLGETHRIPGAAVVLVRDGEIAWASGYGFGNKKDGWEVTPDTVFQVGSISKAVAAVGVMQLAEEGLLDLDAPAEMYLTRWQFPQSSYDVREVTIRRLLSHTAGLAPRGYMGYRPTGEIPSLLASMTGEARRGKAVRIVAEPGEGFKYSGGGYSVLELIIEEISGLGFEEYMQKRVLQPLGMEHSSYEWPLHLQEKTATGYSVFGTSFPTYLFAEKAAAGLLSSAVDLGRFLINLMEGYRGEEAILSRATLREMFTKVDVYGLGFHVHTTPEGELVVSHGGSNQGWKSYMVMFPNKGEGIVILANSDWGTLLYQELTNLWAEHLEVDYKIRAPGRLQIIFSDPITRLMRFYY